jgi:hypothetical protein
LGNVTLGELAVKGVTILCNPRSFPSFELAHRVESDAHRFEVAYGTSFNELYYDFSPVDFVTGADRGELVKQMGRAGAGWLPDVLIELSEDPSKYSHADICEMAKMATE